MPSWDTILYAAFATIGTIEWIKGFFPTAPKHAWRALQLLLCVGYAAAFQFLPAWGRVAFLALALSQIGYDTVISAVKRRIGG